MFSTRATATSVATPSTLWRVLIDVPRWPDWYPGYVAAAADGPLGSGARGSVTLVDGRSRPFEIYDWREGSSFSLGGDGPGVKIRFTYLVEPSGETGSRFTIGHTITGLASPVFGRIFGPRIAGYLPTAAAQLVAVAETARSQ